MNYALRVSEHIWVGDGRNFSHIGTPFSLQDSWMPITVMDCKQAIQSITTPLALLYWRSIDWRFRGETLHVQDRRICRSGKALRDTLSIADTMRRNAHFSQSVLESIHCLDGFSHLLFLPVLMLKESIIVSESTKKDMKLTKAEDVLIRDLFSRLFTLQRLVSETIDLQEHVRKDMAKNNKEVVLHLDDTESNRVGCNKSESINVQEIFVRQLTLKRLVAEAVAVQESIKKQCAKNLQEAVAVYDAYIRAANALIEAIQIDDCVMTETDFLAQMNKPPLYEEFIDFNVGDYEYEKALMRLQVISHATQTEPLLYDVAAHVDIDDTNDGGRVNITDTTAATRVYYNKFYYNAPEVQVTVSGGTGDAIIIPHILRTDGQDENKGRYFEVELQDSATGKLVAGVISWASKGW
jgi:hypothetical protein